ncbi:hypothetical protein IWQ62_006365, partial [Dispira parvispora]
KQAANPDNYPSMSGLRNRNLTCSFTQPQSPPRHFSHQNPHRDYKTDPTSRTQEKPHGGSASIGYRSPLNTEPHYGAWP